ncbi:MAG: iron-sulfur cluster assembly protein [Bacteroidota bacterium]|nr:iron-sulfur cluster assembly protein [Bacteroidota bacterium]
MNTNGCNQEGNYLAIEGKIVDELKTVFDPEIPVNIYDLGLIYEIRVDENCNAYIKMTLTSPSCPMAETIPIEVHQKIKDITGINEVQVDLVFDPPWSKDMMSEDALLQLGML